jgi:outer membrane protein
MKKIIIALVAIVSLASCTQAKFGVVNTEKLIKEYKETVDAEATIKEKSEKTQKDLEHLYQAFQAKVADYQKNVRKMSAKVRAQKEQELGQEQQMLQQKQQQAQYQVQNDGQEAIKKIAEKVNTYIKDYGKKNGYQIIFGTVDLNGAVMFNEDKIDLTNVILKALNDQYTNGSSTKEETPVKEEVKTEETKKEENKK